MILQILKEETKSLHKETEALFFGNEIFSGQLTLGQYQQMILKNLYVYKQLEDSIVNSFPKYFSEDDYFPCFGKHKLLEEDVKELELKQMVYEIQAPVFSSPASILGAVYVIEGSMLGGKVIGRKLREIAPLEKVKRFHFYNTERDNGERWKSFCGFITRNINTHLSIREATKGATSAFKFFHDVYEK